MTPTIGEYFHKICRICLDHGRLSPMFGKDGRNEEGPPILLDFTTLIKEFGRINIKEGDCFPQKICERCMSQLRSAITFRSKCQSSQEVLSKMLLIADTLNMEETHGDRRLQMAMEVAVFQRHFPRSAAQNGLMDIKANDIKKEEHINNIAHTPSDKQEDSSDEVFEELQTYVDAIMTDDIDNSESVTSNAIPIKNKNGVVSKKKGAVSVPKRRRKRRMREGDSGLSKKQGVRCKVCQKQLQHAQSLRFHMQIHNGYHFICEKCGKGFVNETAMRHHCMTRHDAIKPFPCQLCPFRGVHAHELKEHVRAAHTHEKPFLCAHCPKAFSRRTCIRNHLVYHTNVRQYKCDWCPKSFHHRSYLNHHVNNVHNRQYKYQCYVCEVLYAKNHNVRKHLLQQHNIARDDQGKIPRVFIK